MARTIKLTLSYDGTDFAGWQFQLGQRTLQDTLEQTLAKITGQFVRVMSPAAEPMPACMRWRKSSASIPKAQLPAEVIQRALNAELPHDMAAAGGRRSAPASTPGATRNGSDIVI